MLLSRHSRKPSMPIALARYLEPYNAYLRPLGYYATWTVYFLSFAVSPGLVTVLQALCLVLSWILPSVELNVERGRRQILASRWIRPEWAWSDGVPAHRREWPSWAQNAASYVDVRPTLAVGWNACAAKLRALSRRLGWDAKRPQSTGARQGEPFPLFRTVRTHLVEMAQQQPPRTPPARALRHGPNRFACAVGSFEPVRVSDAATLRLARCDSVTRRTERTCIGSAAGTRKYSRIAAF